jgi:hypothetical protein
MVGKHRTRRKRYRPWGRQATLEMAISAFVLLALIATLLVFVFVFHDLPFRIS